MVHFTRACKTLLSENNKTRLTFEKQQEKNKNIICRPWSVRIEKNCALGLEHGPRPAASGRTQDLWHSFSQYGPPGRQIIYIYVKIVKHFIIIEKVVVVVVVVEVVVVVVRVVVVIVVVVLLQVNFLYDDKVFNELNVNDGYELN